MATSCGTSGATLSTRPLPPVPRARTAEEDRVSGVDVYVGDWLLRPVVLLGRGDYWQCAWVLLKGEAEKVKGRGLVAFREETDRVTPLLENSIETV
jgi:hypothetical protein